MLATSDFRVMDGYSFAEVVKRQIRRSPARADRGMSQREQ